MKFEIVVLFFVATLAHYQVFGQLHAQTVADCNKEYACMRHPANCVGNDCSYLVKWRTHHNDQIEFILSAKKEHDNMYVSVAFSNDKIMDDDSVAMCLFHNNQPSQVHTYYNYLMKKHFTRLVSPTEPALGLSNAMAASENGIAVCSFRRAIKLPGHKEFFDLNTEHYLFVAVGKLDDSTQAPTYHGPQSRWLSDQKIGFKSLKEVQVNSQALVKAHGSIMMFTWIVLASTGVLFARYYKFMFPSLKFFQLQFWFVVHRSAMMMTLLLSLIGLLLILIEKNWTWCSGASMTSFVHSILGIIAIGLTFFQPIIAFFRPDKDASNRFVFNWIHRSIGILTYLLSITAIFLGLIIYVQTNLWMILIGWSIWMLVVVASFEIIDFKIKHHRRILEANSLKDEDMGFKLKTSETFKALFMGLHIGVSAAFTAALILIVSKN